MLNVLTAQIIAEERERAIQRRLHEAALRREAMAAKAVAPAPTTSVTDPATSVSRREGDGRPPRAAADSATSSRPPRAAAVP